MWNNHKYVMWKPRGLVCSTDFGNLSTRVFRAAVIAWTVAQHHGSVPSWYQAVNGIIFVFYLTVNGPLKNKGWFYCLILQPQAKLTVFSAFLPWLLCAHVGRTRGLTVRSLWYRASRPSPALWLQSKQIKGWLVDNFLFFQNMHPIAHQLSFILNCAIQKSNFGCSFQTQSIGNHHTCDGESANLTELEFMTQTLKNDDDDAQHLAVVSWCSKSWEWVWWCLTRSPCSESYGTFHRSRVRCHLSSNSKVTIACGDLTAKRTVVTVCCAKTLFELQVVKCRIVKIFARGSIGYVRGSSKSWS